MPVITNQSTMRCIAVADDVAVIVFASSHALPAAAVLAAAATTAAAAAAPFDANIPAMFSRSQPYSVRPKHWPFDLFDIHGV